MAGHDIARLDERGLSRLRATELSLLLQDPLQNLLPYATSLENLASPSAGPPPGLALAISPKLLSTSSIRSGPATRASALRRRAATAALATAVATSPRVLLADEPTASWILGRDSMIDALRHAHELSGATVIVVTHDPSLRRFRAP